MAQTPITTFYKLLEKFADIRALHRPTLHGDGLVCVVCRSLEDDAPDDYPCLTIKILDGKTFESHA